jgi:hypothetical protein
MYREVSCESGFWKHSCRRRDGRQKDLGLCVLGKCMVCDVSVVEELGGVICVGGECENVDLGCDLL